MSSRRRQDTVHGVLLVDKPAGVTSHDVVDMARKALHTRRIGHAGTLDPFATGLLVMLVGRATKLSQFVVGHFKRYQVTAVLGEHRDTYDRDGLVVTRQAPTISAEALQKAIDTFPRHYAQTPPAYSAKKIAGTAAHRLARQGQPVELPPQDVDIYRMEVLSCKPPRFELMVEVSAGTYIRSLVVDIAHSAGMVGYVDSLRRLTVGHWYVEQAVCPGDICTDALLPVETAAADLPDISLDEASAQRFVHGVAIACDADDAQTVAVYVSGKFLGIGRIEQGRLRAVRVVEQYP